VFLIVPIFCVQKGHASGKRFTCLSPGGFGIATGAAVLKTLSGKPL